MWYFGRIFLKIEVSTYRANFHQNPKKKKKHHPLIKHFEDLFFLPYLFLILSGNWYRLISIGKVVMDLYSLPIWMVYKDIYRALPIKLSQDRTWTSFNFFNEPTRCTKKKWSFLMDELKGLNLNYWVQSNSIADGLWVDFMHSGCFEMLWTESIVYM